MKRPPIRSSLAVILGLVCACARPLPPRVPAPAVVERHDAVPALPVSSVAFDLTLDLSLLEPVLIDVLNAELPLRQADWTRVTGEGANPVIETRMQARVEHVDLAAGDGSLQVAATVAYWGKARAELKTPFGKAWLSKGTAWGTEPHPGRVRLTLNLVPSVGNSFELTTQTSLAALSLEAPQGDALCGRIVIKVCVPREQAAQEVHAQLERAIRGAAPRLLAEVDRRIAAQVELSQAVHAALGVLQSASPALEGTKLELDVERLALGQLTGAGDQARLPLELGFRPVFAAEPPGLAARSLSREQPSGAPQQIVFDALLPFARLSQAFGAAAQGLTEDDFQAAGVTLLGVSATTGRLVVTLSMTRDAEELALHAEVDPTLVDGSLALSNAVFVPESKSALSSLGMDEAHLASELGKRRVSVIELVDEHLATLARKLTEPLGLLGRVELSRAAPAQLDGLRYAGSALSLRVASPVRGVLLR